MLNYGRWVVILICFVAVFVSGIAYHSGALLVAGVVGAASCVGGMFIDYFRDLEIRALKEEIVIHRRVEAHRRNRNQRGA